MSENVSNAQILQAITELTDQVQSNSQKIEKVEERLTVKIEETDERLSKKIDQTEERLTEKIDLVDSKLSVLSDGLLKTQAEVKVLKNAESS